MTGDELPLREAVIVALALVAIVPAVAVKLAEVAVAGTVTEAGTVRFCIIGGQTYAGGASGRRGAR